MRQKKILSNLIENTEYELAKYKFILSTFPDAEYFIKYIKNKPIAAFKSKSVNINYTDSDFDFVHDYHYSYLNIVPYCKINFEFRDKEEIVNIYCIPTQTRLMYRSSGYIGSSYSNTIYFSKFRLSFDKNNFNTSCLNSCKLKIIEFIKKYPESKLETKNLDPSLKKLLAFI